MVFLGEIESVDFWIFFLSLFVGLVLRVVMGSLKRGKCRRGGKLEVRSVCNPN